MIEGHMQVLGVIPARIGSTRLTKKPLINIAGRPLIQWVVEAALSSKRLDKLIVATDSEEIGESVRSMGVEPVLTDPALPSGTDRVWAAAKNLNYDIIVNIQGDEPLLRGEWLEALLSPFEQNKDCKMSTVATELERIELDQASVVKALVNSRFEAIYFSRFPIPYTRTQPAADSLLPYKHIGLYAYSYDFLERFCQEPVTELEKAESLEQLRALWLGEKIHLTPVTGLSVGVDTDDDVKKVEKFLEGRT